MWKIDIYLLKKLLQEKHTTIYFVSTLINAQPYFFHITCFKKAKNQANINNQQILSLADMTWNDPYLQQLSRILTWKER